MVRALECIAVVLCLSGPALAQTAWLEEALEREPTLASGLYSIGSVEPVEGQEGVVQAALTVRYLDIHGQPKDGLARLFATEGLVEAPGGSPLVMSAHYEMDPGGGAGLCRLGYIALTPHANPEHCLGNSFNLDLALIEFARRLPFVDRTKLFIMGGSAGGYMTLAMAAEAFPLAACSADVPVLNWSYNAAYIAENAPLSAPKPVEGGEPKSDLPVLHAVTSIALDAQRLFGEDMESDAWIPLSPVACTDRITCPIAMTYSTADMLVPVGQLSPGFFRAPKPGSMPEGFAIEFAKDVSTTPALRRPFLDAVPADEAKVFIQRIPRDYPELTAGALAAGALPAPPEREFKRPFDPERQWSISLFDEGEPLPGLGHLRYLFKQDPFDFLAHHREKLLDPRQLTLPKLVRLMERYSGELSDAPPLAQEGPRQGMPAHRLNYEPLERLDVVTGLLDFAEVSYDHELRLRGVYRELPAARQPFGSALKLGELRDEREALLEAVEALEAP